MFKEGLKGSLGTGKMQVKNDLEGVRELFRSSEGSRHEKCFVNCEYLKRPLRVIRRLPGATGLLEERGGDDLGEI